MFPVSEFGLNNNFIPDIHEAGNDFYADWFARQVNINNLPKGRNVSLNFQGINYKVEVFFDGKQYKSWWIATILLCLDVRSRNYPSCNL